MVTRSWFGILFALVVVASGCTKASLPDDSNLTRDLRDDFSDAILAGDAGEVARLLEQQPLLANEPNPNTAQSPIHVAARTGNAEIIKLLIDHGADPYLLNEEGESAYDLATQSGASDDALALLQ